MDSGNKRDKTREMLKVALVQHWREVEQKVIAERALLREQKANDELMAEARAKRPNLFKKNWQL